MNATKTMTWVEAMATIRTEYPAAHAVRFDAKTILVCDRNDTDEPLPENAADLAAHVATIVRVGRSWTNARITAYRAVGGAK